MSLENPENIVRQNVLPYGQTYDNFLVNSGGNILYSSNYQWKLLSENELKDVNPYPSLDTFNNDLGSSLIWLARDKRVYLSLRDETFDAANYRIYNVFIVDKEIKLQFQTDFIAAIDWITGGFIGQYNSPMYEKIYIEPSDDGMELYGKIKWYMEFYNTRRPHQSLGYNIPEKVYVQAA